MQAAGCRTNGTVAAGYCAVHNELATSFALRNPIAPVHCTLAKFASHKTLAKFRIAKIRNEFANQFRNAKISQCQIRNANFAIAKLALRNSQATCTVHLSHKNLQILSEISHCEFRNVVCEIRNSLANFATALRNSQPCELIAKFPLFCPPILFCA